MEIIIEAVVIDGVACPVSPFPPNMERSFYDGEKFIVTLYAVSEPQGA